MLSYTVSPVERIHALFKHLAWACSIVNLAKFECVQGNSNVHRKGQVQPIWANVFATSSYNLVHFLGFCDNFYTVVGLMRLCLLLQPFNFDVRHIKGCGNIVTCSALSGSDGVNVFF